MWRFVGLGIKLYLASKGWLYGAYARLIGGLIMGTEKKRKDAQQAILYELRRLLVKSGKDSYTIEELCNFIDTVAEAKAQE